METDLTYWDIRRVVQRMVPRQTLLVPVKEDYQLRVRRQGRKFGPYYKEFVLFPQGWKTYNRRVLSGDDVGSALEVSRKAAGCPSPLNLDVWDGKICYWGMNSFTRRYEVIETYSGRAVENCTQAVARDCMADAMLRLDDAGFQIVLTVHDEVVGLKPLDGRGIEEFNSIMVQVPAWAEGLPMGVEGKEMKRYGK